VVANYDTDVMTPMSFYVAKWQWQGKLAYGTAVLLPFLAGNGGVWPQFTTLPNVQAFRQKPSAVS